jgi:hypothetical protein
MPPKEAGVFFNALGNKFAFCNAEWLVKWKDLGYEHATWELETSPFLCTSEVEVLKRSYESRHEAARRALARGKLDNVCMENIYFLTRERIVACTFQYFLRNICSLLVHFRT